MNWKTEKIILHRGLIGVVLFQKSGHRCGYVQVPEGHPYYGYEITYDDNPDLEPPSVHGGVTFSESSKGTGYPMETDGWWIGFDCNHAHDGKDHDLAAKYFPNSREEILEEKEIYESTALPKYETMRSLEYVTEETYKLLNFLADRMEKGPVE